MIAARDGDREAFQQIVNAAIPRAYPLAFAVLRNRQDAEDAVQQAVLNALDKMRSLRDPDAFQAWFLRIVVNQARGIRRRRGRAISFDEAAQITAADPADADRSIDVRDAIAGLPEGHRAVLVLYYSGLSTREVASTLDRPHGTITRMLSESYKMLRRDLRSNLGQQS